MGKYLDFVSVIALGTSAVAFSVESSSCFAKQNHLWRGCSYICETPLDAVAILESYRPNGETDIVYHQISKKIPQALKVGKGTGTSNCGMRKCDLAIKGLWIRRMSGDEDMPSSLSIALGVTDLEKTPPDLNECRSVSSVLIQCVTSRRTAYVTKNKDGSLLYQTYDFKTPGKVSTEVQKGTLSKPTPTKVEATFQIADFTYKLSLPARPGTHESPELSVSKGNKPLQTEGCFAIWYDKKVFDPQSKF